MTPKTQRGLLGLALAATLLLVWLAPQDEAPVAKPTARTQRAAPLTPLAGAPRGSDLKTGRLDFNPQQLALPERESASDVTDLFRASSWFVPPPAPPPPPPAPPPPPPVPIAPPLPFAYIGQIVEDHKVQVILARNDRVVTVFVGDNIDNQYRVESLKGGTLTLVYLPLDIKQTLATGDSQ